MNLPICLLIDNGSLRPEAVLTLRKVAERLSDSSDFMVIPLGLLHSNKINSKELNGENAQTIETFLTSPLGQKQIEFLVLPLFLGPSLGITDWLVGKLDEWKSKNHDRSYTILDCLHKYEDLRLAKALASEIDRAVKRERLSSPMIAMVDHGTPVIEVNRVREKVGNDLRIILGYDESNISTCAMERRGGDKYSFNDPLLENLLLNWAKSGAREIVVALFFLLSGRHAGKNGDLVKICDGVIEKYPKVKIFLTNPLAEHEIIFDILKDRLKEFQESKIIPRE